MLKHLETEFIPYLEGKLSDDDSKRVEDHLRECPACRAEMEETRLLVSALEKNKTLFCPSSSAIFDYATMGSDPKGAVAEHLNECEICRAEYAQYSEVVGNESLPLELWTGIKSRLDAAQAAVPSEREEIPAKGPIRERLSRWFTLRVMIPAMAAAVLAIFLYVPSVPNNMVGFTSVAWESVPKPKDGSSSERRDLLFIILFQGFKEPMPQNRVDALYRAISPTIEIVNRYRATPPVEVSNAIKNERTTITSKSDLGRVLARRWGQGLALIVTITPSTSGVAMEASLKDLRSDVEVEAVEAKDVALDDMENRIRELVRQILVKES